MSWGGIHSHLEVGGTRTSTVLLVGWLGGGGVGGLKFLITLGGIPSHPILQR